MYQIVSTLNGFIREEMMPNPFEFISDNEVVAILFFALFGGKLLYKIAFDMCGIFYCRRENKILGSIGYMFFYYINVEFLFKLSQLSNNVSLICSLYIVFVIGMFILLNKIKIGINKILYKF